MINKRYHWLFMVGAILGIMGPSMVFGELTDADKADLNKATLDIKEAILTVDVGRLSRWVGPDGLTCTDDQYSRSEVVKALKNKTSPLYISLFDTKIFKKECGEGYDDQYPPISDKEFFETAKDLKIQISEFQPGWAEVKIISSVKTQYPREWDFHRIKGKWKITEGLLMRCQCG
jgi:hypothetical protein